MRDIKKESDSLNFISLIVILLIFSLAIIPSTYAGIFDFVKDGFNSITGKTVTSSSTDVSITVGNTPPRIANVSIASSFSIVNDPTSNRTIFFSFIVNDSQGYGNIDATSAVANFTNGTNGGMVRWNNSAVNANDGNCVSVAAIGTDQLNFSCSIRMMYYDTATNWNVSVYVEDINDNSAQNNTVTFSLAETTSFSLQDSSISFPTTTPGSTNITQNDGGIFMNNTGNDNIAAGSVNITAVTMHGDTNGDTFIPVANFTISTAGNSVANSCDISLGGVYRLVNKSIDGTTGFNSTIISSALLPIGAAPHNQETLYLCLRHVPNDLTGQTYSTNTEDDWSIIIQ